MLFTNERLGNFAKDPAVVRFGDRYFLYYTAMLGDGRICVGIATSHDMETWECTGELPLDTPYEAKGAGAPAAILLDGRVHLFYQTYGNWRTDAICHAVSEDGIHFKKHQKNPIFRPNANWCCGRAIDADICLFDGKLFLYYATRDHAFEIQKVGGAYADPTSDLSPECWTHIADGALLSPEFLWEGKCIEAPATVENGGEMFMFYGGSYNCTPQQIGYAVSRDGMFFRKISEAPFIPCGKEGAWNSCESGHPYAFRDDDGRVWLFYQGTNDKGKTWYLSRAEIGFDGNNRPYVIKYYNEKA